MRRRFDQSVGGCGSGGAETAGAGWMGGSVARASSLALRAASRSSWASTRAPSASSARSQTHTASSSAIRKTRSPPDPHEAAGELPGPRAASGPTAARGSRSAVQHGRRREDRQPQERRLRHAQEQVADPRRVGQAPGRWVGADDGPPEEQRRAQVQRVLEDVDRLVVERRVEQRREVAAPHDRGEEDPGHDRERDHAHRPRVQHRQDHALSRLGRRHAQQQRDRRAHRRAAAPRPSSAAGAGPCGRRRASCRTCAIGEARAMSSTSKPAIHDQ